MIDLQPTKCNLCGGKVEYVSNAIIYGGRTYGSGFCYHCTSCGAYVGTHEPKPKEALGLLADAEMREMKMKCHELFDAQWKYQKSAKKRHAARNNAYKELAKKLRIPERECHFGYFDKEMLKKAYEILRKGTNIWVQSTK